MNYLITEYEIAKRDFTQQERRHNALVLGGAGVGLGALTGFEIGNMASEGRNIKRAGPKARAEAVARHGRFENIMGDEKKAKAYGRTLRRAEEKHLLRLSRRSGVKGALVGAPLVGVGAGLVGWNKRKRAS